MMSMPKFRVTRDRRLAGTLAWWPRSRRAPQYSTHNMRQLRTYIFYISQLVVRMSLHMHHMLPLPVMTAVTCYDGLAPTISVVRLRRRLRVRHHRTYRRC